MLYNMQNLHGVVSLGARPVESCSWKWRDTAGGSCGFEEVENQSGQRYVCHKDDNQGRIVGVHKG